MTQNATAAMNWLESQSDMTWFHVPRHWIDVGIGGLYPRGQWPRQADGKTPISTYDAYIAPLAKSESRGQHDLHLHEGDRDRTRSVGPSDRRESR